MNFGGFQTSLVVGEYTTVEVTKKLAFTVLFGNLDPKHCDLDVMKQ